jgi:Putative DNA-binding domain
MLRDFQRSFASGLLKAKTGETSLDGFGVDAIGFGVYAHHTRASLCIAIEEAFPITKRLVGADFFTAMAGQFVTAHPPTQGWLSSYGEAFPQFVAQYPAAADLTYLADVARIEWARVRAANAPDDPGLDLKSLALFDDAALGSLCLSLHGAATLVCSPFPVFDIWQAHLHVDGDEQVPEISLASGPQHVLITRPGPLEVNVSLLDLGDVAFLAALVKNESFATACQAAVSADADYDLGSRLGDLVCGRALAALTDQ